MKTAALRNAANHLALQYLERTIADLRTRLEASDKLSAYRGWRLERAETELEALRRLEASEAKVVKLMARLRASAECVCTNHIASWDRPSLRKALECTPADRCTHCRDREVLAELGQPVGERQ